MENTSVLHSQQGNTPFAPVRCTGAGDQMTGDYLR